MKQTDLFLYQLHFSPKDIVRIRNAERNKVNAFSTVDNLCGPTEVPVKFCWHWSQSKPLDTESESAENISNTCIYLNVDWHIERTAGDTKSDLIPILKFPIQTLKMISKGKDQHSFRFILADTKSILPRFLCAKAGNVRKIISCLFILTTCSGLDQGGSR